MVFFGKLVTAMVTPYDKTGEVDYKKVQELVGHLQKTGSDGVLVCGTTGESPCLTPAERANIWAAAKEAIADDCCWLWEPLIMKRLTHVRWPKRRRSWEPPACWPWRLITINPRRRACIVILRQSQPAATCR